MKDLIHENFQIIILSLFILAALAAVAVFALHETNKSEAIPATIWGTLSTSEFENATDHLSGKNDSKFIFTYRSIAQSEFDQTLVEALAVDEGPDMILVPHDSLLTHTDKIIPISYETYSARDYIDTFAEAAEVYMYQNGVVAFPLSADPLVMYWNRDIISSAGYSQPPRHWEELATLIQRTTVRRGASDIDRSTIAFGEFNNIENAKDILSLLILQSGNPISRTDPQWGLVSTLNSESGSVPSAEAAVRFYTQFSDPAKTTYTWNRALPGDRDMFVAGDLALYIGYASEIDEIQRGNPNLNFDVTQVPQSQTGPRDTTYARILGASILRKSQNRENAYTALLALTTPTSAAQFAHAANVAPVRRDLLSAEQEDAYKSVFYRAAIQSLTWKDPHSSQSRTIFKDMVENVSSGRLRVSEAVERADNDLNALLNQTLN